MYRKTTYHGPENFEVREFFIEGLNEMKGGKKVDKMWIFVTPEGLAQEVIINVIDVTQA